MMVTQTQSYLCGSAPVQKAQSKPLAQCQGERSQGGPAMGCREEARRRHFEGLHFGLNDVRVPALAAKHVSRSSLRFLERHMRLLSPAIRVLQAITWRKRRFIKAVKRNRGAAGIDKVSIKMFAANLDQNLRALLRDLKDGSYQPLPLRRHYIPKTETEFRPLGIPAVRDRVAQEVARRLLHPVFEPLFHNASYGFRPGRNCHQALQAVLKHHEEGYQVVLDADIKGFFDNLSFKVIREAVAQKVADGNILRLVEKFLRSGVMEDGAFKPTTIGTPQGGVISPLLLGLTLSAEKTKITSYGKGYSFLGFWLSARSRRMRPKSLKKFKDKAREITCRKHNFEAHAGKLLLARSMPTNARWLLVRG